jgi:tetratricopeptide (TPR) repeat protein
MSYLLESLGRGLLVRLAGAFQHQLPPPRESADDLAQRLRACPTSVDLATRLGVAYLEELQPAKARRAFARALELAPESAPAKLGLASALDELGDAEGTIRLLERVHECDPGDPAVTFAIGLCHERAGQTGPARRYYQAALTSCDSLRNARERLGAIAIRDGDHETAMRLYMRLAELDGEDLSVVLTLATLQHCAGQSAAAAETFQRALLIEPETDENASFLDTPQESHADAERALGVLEQLIEQHPAVTEYRVHLADLYAKLGQDEQAVDQYNAALELHPTFLEATVKLGTQHYRGRRYEDAACAFNRATELNDQLLTAFVGLGVAQLNSAGQAEADATFDLAASLAPNSTLLYAETARLSLKVAAAEGRPRESDETTAIQDDDLLHAVRGHQRAVCRRDCDAGAHYRLGLLHRQAGAFRDSIVEFRRAGELYPAFAKAHIQLAVALRESGEFAEATACFRQAVVCDQNAIESHYQLGLLFSRRRRFDAVLEHVECEFAGDVSRVETILLALQNCGILDRTEAARQAIAETVIAGHVGNRIGCEPELPLED